MDRFFHERILLITFVFKDAYSVLIKKKKNFLGEALNIEIVYENILRSSGNQKPNDV